MTLYIIYVKELGEESRKVTKRGEEHLHDGWFGGWLVGLFRDLAPWALPKMLEDAVFIMMMCGCVLRHVWAKKKQGCAKVMRTVHIR